jgi:hypothetical protein
MTLISKRMHGKSAFTPKRSAAINGFQIRGWSPITAITSPYRAADLVVG